jgi:hypothetical protein
VSAVNLQINIWQNLALAQLDQMLYRMISDQTLKETRKHILNPPSHLDC